MPLHTIMDGGSVPEKIVGVLEKIQDEYVFLIQEAKSGLLNKTNTSIKRAINKKYIILITEVDE